VSSWAAARELHCVRRELDANLVPASLVEIAVPVDPETQVAPETPAVTALLVVIALLVGTALVLGTAWPVDDAARAGSVALIPAHDAARRRQTHAEPPRGAQPVPA